MRRPQAKFQSSEPVVACVGRTLLEARYTPVGSGQCGPMVQPRNPVARQPGPRSCFCCLELGVPHLGLRKLAWGPLSHMELSVMRCGWEMGLSCQQPFSDLAEVQGWWCWATLLGAGKVPLDTPGGGRGKNQCEYQAGAGRGE